MRSGVRTVGEKVFSIKALSTSGVLETSKSGTASNVMESLSRTLERTFRVILLYATTTTTTTTTTATPT